MSRLLLVRQAATPSTRHAAFPVDEHLDPAGQRAAVALGRFVPRTSRVLVAPSTAAAETAVAASLHGEPKPELSPWSLGRWAGRSLEAVEQQDSAALVAWRRDPDSRSHGGESLSQLLDRVRSVLSRLQDQVGTTVIVADGAVVRAAILAGLGAPIELFWSLDIAPASISELSFRPSPNGGGRWTLLRSSWTPRRPLRPTSVADTVRRD